MSESKTTIVVRPNGPLVVQGSFEIVDADGKPYPVTHGKPVGLCRCGASQTRPFCDGSHRTCGFQADDHAPDAA